MTEMNFQQKETHFRLMRVFLTWIEVSQSVAVFVGRKFRMHSNALAFP